MNISETLPTLPEAIAALVVLSFVGFIGLAITGTLGTTLGAVTAVWMALYSTVVLMSAVKLFGKGTLEAVRNAGGKLVQVAGQQTQQEQ